MTNVRVETAYPLSKSVIERIQKNLSNKYGKGLKIETIVDPKLLGGIKLVVNQKQVDATLAKKIDRLITEIQ